MTFTITLWPFEALSTTLAVMFTAPPEFAAADHRSGIYWFKGAEFERRRRVIDGLRPVAQRLDMPLARLALAWVLAQPGVSIVLAGARNREQVDQNLAGTRHLTPDTLSAIDAIVAEAFAPAHATEQARILAATWGPRERFIVERLDGKSSAETIAAEWTDRGDRPMIAAQVKVFVDQLLEQGLAEV